MPEKKKPKDVKDLSSWDDDLNKLFSSKKAKDSEKKDKKGEHEALDLSKSEKLPSAEELETEWEKKIKDANKSDKQLFSESSGGTPKKRANNLEDVFSQLKKKESGGGIMPSKMGKEDRLSKIGGVVKGQTKRVEERELTGVGVPGIYKLYPMGSLPPLNLLSKIFMGMSGKSLEKTLSKSNIPLYPDEYVSFSVGISFIFSIFIFLAMFVLTSFNLVFPLLSLILSLLLLSLLFANWPSLKINSSTRGIDQQLPFALRHMSALLSAGISIFDTITSVSKADYGPLSVELDKVVWDVKSGENLTEALEEASERINSSSFNRVTVHIRRALQMGGDVASIISQIADDMTFEMRMKVSDFVEKLNAFAIVYLIGGIVGPVVIGVFTVVGSAGPLKSMGGAMIDKSVLLFMVLLVFPMLMAIITYVVKLMEPKV
jgi:flagellar protein FlaJ